MQYDVDERFKTIIYSSNSIGIPQLFLLSAEVGSKPKQITDGIDPVIFGYISPNGDEIVYRRDKGGDEMDHLFSISVDNGNKKQLTSIAYRTLGVSWHPNGKEILRSIVTPKGCGIESINLRTGENFMLKEATPPLADLSYSHDGKWIVCTAYTSFTNSQINVINRVNPEEIVIYNINDDSREENPSWSPDNKRLAFRSEAMGRGQIVIQEFQGDDNFFLGLGENEEASLGAGLNANFPVWNSKSDTIYYIINKYGRHSLHAHPLDGEKEPALPFPKGVVAKPSISKDRGFIAALHSSMTSPEGIYMHEFGSKTVVPLTPREFNIDLSLLIKPQSVWYKSFDKKSIHSWYISAANISEPFPAVVRVHGGPWLQYNDDWLSSISAHCFSQNGIATFSPNFRGSTGYGPEFQNLDIGDIGGGDLEDIIHGVYWLRSKSEIDKTKIVITGGSYGGYMTLFALAKRPDIFVTGASLVPITDWIELYNLSDPLLQQYYKELFRGNPKQKKDLYIDRSPITHISNIKAPVMIMAAKNDSNCPIEPIEKFINILKEMNHPHEFIIEENAGHVSYDCEKNIQISIKVIDFIKRNLT